jgi:hypothetical protein
LVLAKAPVLTDETPRDVGNRRVWCRRYEKCLNYAMAHDWYGFHCDSCAVEDQFTPAEILERSRGAMGGHPDGLFDALGPDEESANVSEKEELSLVEAADFVGMGKNWLVRLGNKGEIKMRKDDSGAFFVRSSLVELKAKRDANVDKPKAPAKPSPSPLGKVKLAFQCVDEGLLTKDEAFDKIRKLAG